MEYIKLSRGGTVLYEGFRYQINHRGTNDRIFWRCHDEKLMLSYQNIFLSIGGLERRHFLKMTYIAIFEFYMTANERAIYLPRMTKY